MSKTTFMEGDSVIKDSGDYAFFGIIVSKFQKLSGQTRYVVENEDGILHIFSENQIRIEVTQDVV